MNINDLKNKSIIIFGKSRAFSKEEFESQLKVHSISLVKEVDESTALIIDGKMMSPYEQNASEAIYNLKKYKFTSIELFEKELAKHLNEDALLMSLKLSGNKERLKTFIQNSQISDSLFLRLLKMYKWDGLDFFENDDNRDVSAALIRRYYKNIEQNHNVEYSSLGIMHLISQTTSSELIQAIVSLEPIFKNEKIEAAIATHINAPKNVLEYFINKSSIYVKTLIAMRPDLDESIQIKLLNFDNDEIKEALSYNEYLCESVVHKLLQEDKYVNNIARYIKLNDSLYERLKLHSIESLAKNNSLTLLMQENLATSHERGVMLSLAGNEHLDSKVVAELFFENIEDVNIALYENSATPKEDLIKAYDNHLNHFSLAHNENTPQKILSALAESPDLKVVAGVASNPNTPINILYQLQLDSKLARLVKENPTFLDNIKKENIGWE